MSIEEIVELSREFGSNPAWVLAGGGNTSFKNDDYLWVKASGFALATIGPEGFAQMDRSRLAKCAQATYPDDPAQREAGALADLMAARVDGEGKRPSVETLMHHLIPYPLVVHTHPALVNGITCGQQGASAARRVLGDDVLWIRAIEPGYILSLEIAAQIAAFTEAHGEAPRVLLMQNHGLVVAGTSAQEIRDRHESIAAKVGQALIREPDFSDVQVDDSLRDSWHARIAERFPDAEIAFDANREFSHRLASPQSAAPVTRPFSPDHIVYAGVAPLFMASDATAHEFHSAVATHISRYGAEPRIVAVLGLGAFAVADSLKATDSALSLFTDAVRVAAYTESFGGPRHLDADLVAFIEGWEVEQFRKKLSTGGAG